MNTYHHRHSHPHPPTALHTWTIPGLVIVATLGLVIIGAGNSYAGKIRVAYSKVWSQPTIFIGIKKGLFNTPTLKTEFIDLRASMKMVEAIFAGSADAAVASFTAIPVARERGLNLKIVANLNSYKDGIGKPNGLYVRKDSGITSIKGLKGKQIGISSYGSSLDIETRTLLMQAGMNPKTDVQLLEVPIPKGVRAFMAKRLDAYYFPASFVSALKKQELQLANMFAIKEFKGQAILNFPITMNGDFIKKDRETALEWLTQYLKALRLVVDKPEEANQIWSAWSKRKKDVGHYYIPRDGSVDQKGIETYLTLMLRYGYLKKPQKVRDIVDTSLLAEANRRLGK